MPSAGSSDGPAHLGQVPSPPSYQTTRVSGWLVRHYSVVDSTNLVASRLPAWTAVRSDVQTSGRGRFQRCWVSDRGGLWLSAVVPHQPEMRLLPLAMGLASIQALESLGVQNLRMRWPNDVMVGRRKLAGLLIDQFQPDTAVVGVGINCENRPEGKDPGLSQRVTRLADLLPACPGLEELTARMLECIGEVAQEMRTGQFSARLPGLNALWRGARPVRLELDNAICSGQFLGVDQNGRLRLEQPDGTQRFFEAHQVRHLTETETEP